MATLSAVTFDLPVHDVISAEPVKHRLGVQLIKPPLVESALSRVLITSRPYNNTLMSGPNIWFNYSARMAQSRLTQEKHEVLLFFFNTVTENVPYLTPFDAPPPQDSS